MPQTLHPIQDLVFIHEQSAYRNPAFSKPAENLAYTGLGRRDKFLNDPASKPVTEGKVPPTELRMEWLAEGLLAARQTQQIKWD